VLAKQLVRRKWNLAEDAWLTFDVVEVRVQQEHGIWDSAQNGSTPLFALPERLFRPPAFDCDAGYVSSDLRQALLFLKRSSRDVIVHRERACHLPAAQQDRIRPACAQSVFQSQFTIFLPKRIGLDIPYDDRLPKVSRSSAAAGVWTNG